MCIEIERKFLLSHTPDWSAVHFRTAEVLEIEQIYLKVEHDIEERIRKISQNGRKTYYMTRLEPRRPGIRNIYESEITATEFDRLRKLGDPRRNAVCKRRRVFRLGRHVFELDEIYEPTSRACCILEVQLSAEGEPVTLPHFLAVDREVTAEAPYANSAIALG